MKRIFEFLSTEYLSFSMFLSLIIVICGNAGAIILVSVSNSFWFDFLLIVGMINIDVVVFYDSYLEYKRYKQEKFLINF